MFGQTGMVLSLFCITMFNYLEHNNLMLLAMVMFLCCYSFGIGTIVFIHVFETNVDSIMGLANQTVSFMGFATSLITPTLIVKLTVPGTFAFYGFFSLLGLIYMTKFVRHTSIIETDKDGN